jgi:hypothetical protein
MTTRVQLKKKKEEENKSLVVILKELGAKTH